MLGGMGSLIGDRVASYIVLRPISCASPSPSLSFPSFFLIFPLLNLLLRPLLLSEHCNCTVSPTHLHPYGVLFCLLNKRPSSNFSSPHRPLRQKHPHTPTIIRNQAASPVFLAAPAPGSKARGWSAALPLLHPHFLLVFPRPPACCCRQPTHSGQVSGAACAETV
ncbi:hypothetical protein EJ06DRAFT_540583 [Trichodelitschia bisporula]|uniref:Uncharacterized protein n=1 Tax=Trichodelitschia bisporula TaxID=703511 RepID=A0A6G1IAD3_9PEZI|nr:hypothetical protein EJ06DRAFT_540583 [Trichodelitschia bisporula]